MESEDKSNDTTPNSLFKILAFESVAERNRNLLKRSHGGRSPTKMPTQLIHPADDDESGKSEFVKSKTNRKSKYFSDSDEPLLSGSGEVNRECSKDILTEWQHIIDGWKEEPEKFVCKFFKHFIFVLTTTTLF